MATQIVNMIIQAMETHLTQKLITDVAANDPSRADVVKVGRVLENPKTNNIRVGIHGGDPEQLDYLDGIVTLEDHKRIGFYVPVREIGGGTAWWRRGTCPFQCYFIDGTVSEDNATDYAYQLYGRLQANISNLPVASLIDSFGEQAYYIFLVGATMHPSGGNGKWIFRGKVHWSCLTWKG